MLTSSKTTQWTQLLAVSSIHFLADMFAGAVPALQPRLQDDFGVALVIAAALVATLNLTSNGVQILIGHTRPEKTTMFFLPVGMLLAAALCLLVLVPRGENVEIWLFVVIVACGMGIGFVHPEGFRAIHALEGIPATTSTAVFMIGGVLGFGAGGWFSTSLVSGWGLAGLGVLGPFAILAAATILMLKVRIAVDEKTAVVNDTQEEDDRISFWPIWLMTIPASIATCVVVGLLPIRLEELGFELKHGGFCQMLFLAGSVPGMLFWAALARRTSSIGACTIALFVGMPILVTHLALIEHRHAAWILAPSGFCLMAAYPLMINAARFARGLNLGGRMAMSAGGAWGVASLAFIFFGSIAERHSANAVMRWMWIGYLLSVLIGLYIMRKSRVIKIKSIIVEGY